MFVAGGPFRDVGCFGDFPSRDEAFADAAVLADRWQIGEEVGDPVRVADRAPGELGGGVSHDWNDSALVAAGAIGDHLTTDHRGQMLESAPVGT